MEGEHMIEADNYFALRLENEGKAAEMKMLVALNQSGIFKLCYAHKSRVKSEEKLLTKKKIKCKKKPDYVLTDISDVIGVRFVTLFRLEMPVVFEKIIQIINHKAKLDPNPFCEGAIEEIIIYKTISHDPIPTEIKEIMKTNNIDPKIIEIKDSEEGYSSIHIVTRSNHDIKKISCDSPYFLPVEIQIRTVFEDAWGEIDHKYGYVLREGKEQDQPIENPEIVLRHLKILKKFSDACAEYANEIHIEATQSDEKKLAPTRVISIASNEELIEYFKNIRVDHEDIELFLETIEIKEQGEIEELKELKKGRNFFSKAANINRKLSEKYEDKAKDENNEKEYLFYYYVKMNEAVCLFLTNQKESIYRVLQIYSLLEERYDNFPLLKMRLGQAFCKVGKTDSGIEKFSLAHKALKEFEVNGCQFSTILPRVDYEHMKLNLPKAYGYELWLKSTQIEGNTEEKFSEKIELLINAYNITTEMENSVEIDKRGAMDNNLLYYALEIAKVSSHGKTPADFTEEIKRVKKQLPYHLNIIISQFDLENSNDIQILDTVAKAYHFLKKHNEAENIANKIMDLCLDKTKNIKYDPDVMKGVLEDAYLLTKKVSEKKKLAS